MADELHPKPGRTHHQAAPPTPPWGLPAEASCGGVHGHAGRHVSPSTGTRGPPARPPRLRRRLVPSAVHGSEERVALLLLLVDDLEVLVDDGHGQKDAGAATYGPEEVRHNGQSADASPAKGGGCGDVAVQHPREIRVAVAWHHQLLVPELLGNVTRGGSGDVDPRPGKQGARYQHEGHVEERMDGVVPDVGERVRRGYVVGKAAHWDGLPRVLHFLPLPHEVHDHVTLEALVEQLREKVEV
mmetsp:Transcript_30166/g.81664  ORF Transcript_30166/g.81664 Transcript_30166/m.81664 type:complete len:242 (+) Transcript_30166:70-795(+)